MVRLRRFYWGLHSPAAYRTCRGVFLALHGYSCVVAEQLILLLVQRSTIYAQIFSHRLRACWSHAQGDDRNLLRCRRELLGSTKDRRVILRVRLLEPCRQQ